MRDLPSNLVQIASKINFRLIVSDIMDVYFSALLVCGLLLFLDSRAVFGGVEHAAHMIGHKEFWAIHGTLFWTATVIRIVFEMWRVTAKRESRYIKPGQTIMIRVKSKDEVIK